MIDAKGKEKSSESAIYQVLFREKKPSEDMFKQENSREVSFSIFSCLKEKFKQFFTSSS